MNGYSYSKIKVEVAGNESSIAMESSTSDLMPIPEPETPKPTPNPIKNSNPDTQCPSDQEDDGGEYDGRSRTEGNANVGGEKISADPTLRRNSSVSSAYALQLQAAVKRAFSMRRSCSVSESYSRIHDQYVTLTSPLDEDEASDISGTKGSAKKKKNTRDKILKAWKKIFKL